MAFRYTGFADEADRQLPGQIEITKRAGWSSIELRGVNGKNVCDLNDDEWKAAWDQLQAGGITVAGFGSQIANWGRPITTDFALDTAELRRAAPHMRQAGVKLIRIMSYPNVKDEPWPVATWKAEVFRRLKEIARIAEGEGVILGHENCNGYGGLGPAETLELLDAVNSPALTLIFDTGNNTLHDHDATATWDFYNKVKAHVTHVHIKAAKPGADGKFATCYVDEDPVQRRILADLKANGYHGWLSIEPHLAAAIHAGKEVSDADKAKSIYIEYTRRLEAMTASL